MQDRERGECAWKGIAGVMPDQEENKAWSQSGACVMKCSGICTNMAGPTQMLVSWTSGLKRRWYSSCVTRLQATWSSFCRGFQYSLCVVFVTEPLCHLSAFSSEVRRWEHMHMHINQMKELLSETSHVSSCVLKEWPPSEDALNETEVLMVLIS